MPTRPSKTAPAAPTFAELEESIRQRLITNGQHGALADFAKYTAAVHEKLNAGVTSTPVGAAGVSPELVDAIPDVSAPAAKPKKARKPKASK